jgi:hypothetical protein
MRAITSGLAKHSERITLEGRVKLVRRRFPRSAGGNEMG